LFFGSSLGTFFLSFCFFFTLVEDYFQGWSLK
jgi:hypothetical protein